MQQRRKFLASAGAAVGVMAFPAIVRAQNRSITWVTHPAIFGATGDGELLKQFEAKTGIKVEVVTFPTETLAQRLQSEFVARSPAFDVMNVADAFWSPTFARFLEPLDDMIKKAPLPSGGLDDFSPGMVDFFRLPQAGTGAVMAIPLRMSVSLLYYRKDLVAATGLPLPKTLEDFGRLAKAMTRDGVNGVVIQGAQGQVAVLDWYEHAAPFGVDFLRMPEQRRAAFNTPAGVAALAQRRQFIADGIADKGCISYGFDDAITAISQGKAAMSVMFSAYWPRFEDVKQSKVAGQIGYASPMRADGVTQAYPARGWGLAINAVSQKKEMAWEFMRFISDAPQQKWMGMNKGNAVTRLSVLSDAEFKAKVPISAALASTQRYAKMMPSTPQLPRMYDALSRHLSAALSGTAKPEDALKQAETEVNALFT
jgi:multiple sugar transport system substrate-binding protein